MRQDMFIQWPPVSSHFLTYELFHDFLSDMAKGSERFWIIRDNFVAKSYRKHFKHVQPGSRSGSKYFIKDNFEYSAFCNSKYSSTQQNILARLQNTMVSAIKSTNKLDGDLLPKYFLVV